MNREIKFRLYSDSLRVMYSPENQIGNLWSIKEAPNGIVKTDNGDVLMQFIGIKDCDGKDIYENDIVECEIEQTIGDDINITGVVLWSGCGYYEVLFPDYGQSMEMSGIISMRVIGNDIQNPELLQP
jgi:hypothetical protein